MEIVNAGGELEDKLSEYKDDIDEKLLKMMMDRIKLAREYGEVGITQVLWVVLF